MEAPYAPPAYKDRRTGLIIFGIALIALGGLFLLFVPLAAVGQLMAAKVTGASNFRMVLPTLLMYCLLGALFVTLGIGSIKGRRWSRAVTLVTSWAWLLVGAASLVMFIWLGPAMLKAIAQAEGGQALPPSAQAIFMVIMVGFLGLFFIIIPGALVLFYGSAHVKATVEAMDPQPRWTDACPLPVLAVSLLAAFSAVTLLTMPVAYNGAIPMFGVILTGFVGSLVWLALAALLGYAAWNLYHLRPSGWWIVMALLAFLTISNILTFSRVDLSTLYRHMGYPEAQIQQIEKFNIFTPTQIVIWSVVCMVPIIGYLIFIKKYFRRPTAVQPTPVTA